MAEAIFEPMDEAEFIRAYASLLADPAPFAPLETLYATRIRTIHMELAQMRRAGGNNFSLLSAGARANSRTLNAQLIALEAERATWQLMQRLSAAETGQPLNVAKRLEQFSHARLASRLESQQPRLRRYAAVVSWCEQLAVVDSFQSKACLNLQRSLKTLPQDESLDPDLGIRKPSLFHPTDREEEDALLLILWQLIRAGRTHDATEVCRDYQQHWRAATLAGATRWDNDNSAGGTSHGLRRRQLWKQQCLNLSNDRYVSTIEAAVYGVLANNLPKVLLACSDWLDGCWAYFRYLHSTHLDQAMRAELSIRSPWPDLNLDDVVPLVNQADTHLGPEHVFRALETHRDPHIRAQSEDCYHQLQKLLILGDYQQSISYLITLITSSPITRPSLPSSPRDQSGNEDAPDLSNSDLNSREAGRDSLLQFAVHLMRHLLARQHITPHQSLNYASRLVPVLHKSLCGRGLTDLVACYTQLLAPQQQIAEFAKFLRSLPNAAVRKQHIHDAEKYLHRDAFLPIVNSLVEAIYLNAQAGPALLSAAGAAAQPGTSLSQHSPATADQNALAGPAPAAFFAGAGPGGWFSGTQKNLLAQEGINKEEKEAVPGPQPISESEQSMLEALACCFPLCQVAKPNEVTFEGAVEWMQCTEGESRHIETILGEHGLREKCSAQARFLAFRPLRARRTPGLEVHGSEQDWKARKKPLRFFPIDQITLQDHLGADEFFGFEVSADVEEEQDPAHVRFILCKAFDRASKQKWVEVIAEASNMYQESLTKAKSAFAHANQLYRILAVGKRSEALRALVALLNQEVNPALPFLFAPSQDFELEQNKRQLNCWRGYVTCLEWYQSWETHQLSKPQPLPSPSSCSSSSPSSSSSSSPSSAETSSRGMEALRKAQQEDKARDQHRKDVQDWRSSQESLVASCLKHFTRTLTEEGGWLSDLPVRPEQADRFMVQWLRNRGLGEFALSSLDQGFRDVRGIHLLTPSQVQAWATSLGMGRQQQALLSLEVGKARQKSEQIRNVRQQCIPEMFFLLHRILLVSQRYRECLSLARVLADEHTQLYSCFSKDYLRLFLKDIRDAQLQDNLSEQGVVFDTGARAMDDTVL